jgi:uncharacterized membrane protein
MTRENAQTMDLAQHKVTRLERWAEGLARHWLAWANLFWGLLTGIPWLAPILMHAGATRLAGAIYTAYGFMCHQLANRSYFLFGPKWMYAYTELLPYAPHADTMQGLRAFTGVPALGYKVAWSDRMVSLYGAIFLGGIAFALLRRWLRSPRWAVLLPLIVPLVVDGGTHALGDLAGLGRGFRYDNAWLASLTRNALPASFYAGNALGSFNWWMRLITGLLAGVAIAWMLYPLVDAAFRGGLETPSRTGTQAPVDGV